MVSNFNKKKWFESWDPKTLYYEKLRGTDQCCKESPINSISEGIICGPVLRLLYVDYDKNQYLGSILIVTKNLSDLMKQPVIKYVRGPLDVQVNTIMEPTKATDKFIDEIDNNNNNFECELTEGAFTPTLFHEDQLGKNTFQFYRYMIDLPLVEHDQMVRYSVDSKWESHYRFYVPSRTKNFNVMAYSCSGFSLAVDTSRFKGSLWYDVLQKHSKVYYNVMLGGGDQIYSDSIKLYSPKVAHWINTKNQITKYTMKVDLPFRKDMENFYLKEYLEWYGFGHWHGSTEKSMTTQRLLPLALATIPSINIWDDHDIIDGFGSYNDSFMQTEVFSNIGQAAYKYYMLFQHHVSIDEKEPYLSTKNWILGSNPGAYIKEKSHSIWTKLGPNMALLGLDCRTERKLKQVISWDTYKLLFQRVSAEIELSQKQKEQRIDHLLVMLGIPIAYTRLIWLEWLFSSKLLAPLKYLSKKNIVGHGLLNDFNGDVELLDDLNDHWCARYHKAERNFLVSKLQDLSAKYGVRVTILSGDVHLASIGRFRTKLHSSLKRNKDANMKANVFENPEYDSRLIFNVISSAIVNTPPPDGMARLLQEKNKLHCFDDETEENNIEIFKIETNSKKRKRSNAFLNKRNWSDIIPVKNVIENEYLQEMLNIKVGDKHVPGIIKGPQCDSMLLKQTKKSNLKNQSYPVTKNGIICSIHAEIDESNMNSETSWYFLPIPDLQTGGGEKLSHTGMKHSII